jgi:hypothetical protein
MSAAHQLPLVKKKRPGLPAVCTIISQHQPMLIISRLSADITIFYNDCD